MKKEVVSWKMATTWPLHFPMLGEGTDMIAQLVDKNSGRQFKISVYGNGEPVLPRFKSSRPP